MPPLKRFIGISLLALMGSPVFAGPGEPGMPMPPTGPSSVTTSTTTVQASTSTVEYSTSAVHGKHHHRRYKANMDVTGKDAASNRAGSHDTEQNR